MKLSGINLLQDGDMEIRALSISDVTTTYVEWLNNPKVNQYLESRFYTHTLESVKEFVSKCIESDAELLMGIFMDKRHVGNIKLGCFAKHHKRAELGLFIGDENYWGKGVASRAISLVTQAGFESLNLHKIVAGCYEPNVGSRKAFEKAGYVVEGRLSSHSQVVPGEWCDMILLSKINDA
jgi:RimJ/RimL family protein N-acetyltransferase